MKRYSTFASPFAVQLLSLIVLAIPQFGSGADSQVVSLRPGDVTTIVAADGESNGKLVGGMVRAGFVSPEHSISWTVLAPENDDYVVSLIYNTPEAQTIEVSAGESVVQTKSVIPSWKSRPVYWRQELPETLPLRKGTNRITFRLPEGTAPPPSRAPSISKPQKTFALYSIELGTAEARRAQLERAKELRSDHSWMIDGKYGLFVHWSPLSYALHGDRPRSQWHEEAVSMFDVRVFADAVERTGAAWLLFTVTHGGFYWPGPSEAIDRILPGRTAKRDLLGEIITELDKRNIRTLFYLHNNAGGDDPPWAKAIGAVDRDRQRFSANIEAILRESSLRYGEKLSGYAYIDATIQNDYPLDPSWESWARAIKAGNPEAVVGISTQRGPMLSPFSELAVTDGGSTLSIPDLSVIGQGKQLGDVTPARWFKMDGWISNGPMNGDFGKGPRYSATQYVQYFQKMAEAKIPVTINLIGTADVTSKHPIFNPECLEIMDEVRRAIRGDQGLETRGR